MPGERKLRQSFGGIGPFAEEFDEGTAGKIVDNNEGIVVAIRSCRCAPGCVARLLGFRASLRVDHIAVPGRVLLPTMSTCPLFVGQLPQFSGIIVDASPRRRSVRFLGGRFGEGLE